MCIRDRSRSSKVKSDGANWKRVGRTCKCSQGSNLVSVTVFEIFRVKLLTVHLLTLVGLTNPQNFSPIAQTVYEICVTKVFRFLALGGLTPGPKFTKRGEDLADTEIYHPAKFHGSTQTRARDIRYQNPADKQTNKQTVNDISTTCLSACVDNKRKANSAIQNIYFVELWFSELPHNLDIATCFSTCVKQTRLLKFIKQLLQTFFGGLCRLYSSPHNLASICRRTSSK